MKKILLDTNAYAAFFSGDAAVLDALAGAEIVYASVIVLGELYAGFKGGSREVENKKQLEIFLNKATVHVLDVTAESAALFGEVKNKLKRAGTPLPINDIWIAAHCLETGSRLLTYDEHFLKISGLQVWDKLKP